MSATILPFIRPPSEAIMALHSHIPKTAMTAQLLGTHRTGHAIQISSNGLMLTVGYSIMEASEIWVSNHRGKTSQATVLSHDYDSGIALLRPDVSLGNAYLETASSDSIKPGDQASILTSDKNKPTHVSLLAKEEYVGRWEYLLEEALYTVPLCENWTGAALLNAYGKLCGIGCLALGLQSPEGDSEPGNLFIPTDLIMPHINHMAEHGKKPGFIRPWLGTLIDEQDAELQIVGLYQGGPAAEAGILPGDIILCVDKTPVNSLAELFRALWHYGSAGSKIPITLSDGSSSRNIIVNSIDRDSFFVQHKTDTIN